MFSQEIRVIWRIQIVQVSLARRRRKEEMAIMFEAITVVEALKTKMEQDLKDIEMKTNNLVSLENKLMTMKSLSLEGKMSVELAQASFGDVPKLMDMVRMEEEVALELQLLERGLARSSVKIRFDKVDDVLSKLMAQDDSVTLKLCTNPKVDSSKIFLTSFLVRQIFKDKISERYPQFIVKRIAAGSTANAALSAKISTSARPQFSTSSTPSLPQATMSPPIPSPPRLTSSKSSSTLTIGKVTRVDPAMDRTVAMSNRPRAFFKVQLESETPFRVVIELRPDLAPTMVDNFLKLCRGLKDGRGYKGSKV